MITDSGGCGYTPPSLDATDTRLLTDLLKSAREVNIDGYGVKGQSAMAALIIDVLGLGGEYKTPVFSAIGGAEFRVCVTGEVSI